MKKVRPMHLALITAKTSPYETLHGRTRIHKLIFLEQQMSRRKDVSFRPYYYGPFSDELANGLSEAVALGLLQEQVVFGIDSPDVVEYKYPLTDAGKLFYNEVVANIESLDQIEKYLGKIQGFTEDLTATKISIMAKALFILKGEDSGRKWKLSEIVREARNFKWKLKDRELLSIMSKLVELGLVRSK